MLNLPTPFDVVATAYYRARNETEISLKVGETYTVYQIGEKGLWQTVDTNNKPCWFPCTHVQVKNKRSKLTRTPYTSRPFSYMPTGDEGYKNFFEKKKFEA